MRKALKILAILAIILVVALTSSKVFAAEGDLTITVTGDVNGRTLSVYKLFNIDKVDGENIYYSWAGKSKEYFTAKGYDTIAKATDYVKGLSESQLNKLAKDYYENSGATADARQENISGDTVNFTVNGNGYYLVFDETNISATNKEAKSAAILSNVTASTEVEIKVDSIGIPDKTVDVTSASVGDTVNFTVTSTVPTMAGYESYTFNVVDTMSKGLTFNNDVVVKIDGTVYTDVTTTPVSNDDGTTTITVQFNNFISQKENAGKNIVLTYSAVLNDNAAVEKDNTNTVKLVYSNDPYSNGTGETGTDEVHVYTFAINFTKKNTNGTVLAGAKFKLYNADGEQIGEEVTSDANGAFSFAGLKDGTYKLVETEAPSGYAVPNFDGFTFKITSSVDNKGELSSVRFDYTSDENNDVAKGFMQDTSSNTPTISVDVLNAKDGVLPTTGGIGTKIFTVVGIVVMIAAAGILVYRNKNK